MDEFAQSVGWFVIGCAIFYVIGKLIIHYGDAEQERKQMILSVADHERRLAYRRIWQSTDDASVRSEVKFQYGPWALLDLETNDDDYDRKMISSAAYRQALQNVKDTGFVCRLEAGKIVSRPINPDA